MEDRRRHSDRRKNDRDQEDNGSLYAIVGCGNYRFALPKQNMLAINAQSNIVPMPFSKPWFAGVASIHGYIASVTDLSEYLDLPPARDKEGARVLLMEHDGSHFGLLVDAVHGVMQCLPCERSRAFYPLNIERYMQGQCCADGQYYDEFNIRQLLSEECFIDAIDSTLLPATSVSP